MQVVLSEYLDAQLTIMSKDLDISKGEILARALNDSINS